MIICNKKRKRLIKGVGSKRVSIHSIKENTYTGRRYEGCCFLAFAFFSGKAFHNLSLAHSYRDLILSSQVIQEARDSTQKHLQKTDVTFWWPGLVSIGPPMTGSPSIEQPFCIVLCTQYLTEQNTVEDYATQSSKN